MDSLCKIKLSIRTSYGSRKIIFCKPLFAKYIVTTEIEIQIKKRILLLGGGHANIQVLHKLARMDQAQLKVTLISDVAYSPYSGMIPSYLAGVYDFNQLHFDLNKICHDFGFEFVEDQVTEIDALQSKVFSASGASYTYDICSVNVGIQPRPIAGDVEEQANVIYLKPISKLIQKWNTIHKNKPDKNASLDFTVIGGGAAAFEIAISCRRKYRDTKNKIRIISGSGPLLQNQNERTRDLACQSLKRHNIELIVNNRVVKIEKDDVVLSDQQKIPRQICLVATTAQAPELFQKSNLPTSPEGFVKVNADLRIEGFENIFAAGDCCHFSPAPLAKAGVFAVRQGPVLFANIKRLIEDNSKLTNYTPQKHFLTIMVSGENTAIASYRNFAFEGFFAWKLKNLIDLRFMKRFQPVVDS